MESSFPFNWKRKKRLQMKSEKKRKENYTSNEVTCIKVRKEISIQLEKIERIRKEVSIQLEKYKIICRNHKILNFQNLLK